MIVLNWLLMPACVHHRWFDWKESRMQRTGVALGLDYAGMLLWSDSGICEDAASAGMLSCFGTRDAVGRGTKNTGSFIMFLAVLVR